MAGKKKTETKKEAVKANALTISAETFKTLVSKAYKGVGNNKLLPLTQLMCIRVKDGELTLIASDETGTNYLYVTQKNIEGDFYATVLADQFAKLIEKQTCEKITMEADADKLNITGNGKYTIALQYDEMGNAIQYPDPLEKLVMPEAGTGNISLSVITKMLNSVKPALAVSMDAPYLTGYYAGDIIAATNGDEMSIYSAELMEKPVILSPTVIELLALSADDKFSVETYEEDVLVFYTSDIKIYSHAMEGIDDYPVDALKQFKDADMPYNCKLSKSALLQALDRISLFIGAYDDNAIKLTFDGKAVKISSLASTGVEDITYMSGSKDKFECTVDSVAFTKHVKAQSTDTVEIQFGDESAIKLIDGDIVQILSLFEEDNAEA